MFERAALIHYHEIGLKGRNRAAFERRLEANLTAAVADISARGAERIASRLLIHAEDPAQLDELVRRASVIPGVSSVAPCWITSRDADDQNRAALEAAKAAGKYQSFAVQARRSNTPHKINSMAMNRVIGQYLVDHTAKKVDLSKPDLVIRVEVVQGETYISSVKVLGPGGLPVGTSGKVVSLLSAGIDSPVATWRIAKRGAVMVAVHFSGCPQVAATSERLVTEIGDMFGARGAMGRIYYVPFGDLQKEISLNAPPDYRVLLYRRLMIRVAERIAALEGAKALVTGESLGQVASQTLENIAAVDDVATLPILRPLIGSDKVEIIREARRLGTYELSTQAHDDCCTLFMPRSPVTHARLVDVVAAEANLDLPRMTADALASMTYRDFGCPAYKPPKRMPEGVGAAG
ncbi:MAG: tRNA 4-thiouridine(8) synthase ThiI [Actinobacteria bacterium HGW-Actinobacteria-10]|jgi:thiamine biosynthesis protein ThiI|nr:MAG: tRNA 4-thiouridine(8) synthase ThiI [Actinobacteria bacterium HGW-Actinobacteria-10]